MNRQDANTEDLSRVIPDRIQGASMICLPKITNDDYEKDVKSSVLLAKYYCDNAMVISHNSRINMKQKEETIVYDLENVDEGIIVGSNQWNNKFLIYSGEERITGGDNIENRYVLVNNPSFLGKIIGGKNSTNILDLSQLKDEVIGVNVNYSLKSNASGSLRVEVNGHGLTNDQINNEGIFNYHYVGRKDKLDKVLCMGYSEHFKGNEDRDIIIDSRGGSNDNERDVIEGCKKVIVSPYTTVKGGKSNYTFYVKTAGYKGKNLHSEINVDGIGSVVFPEFDLLDDCDQITYSRSSNTLSLKMSFGQNNKFTLDIRNYVEESSNRPHFLLIDKNGSNIVPKIERSDTSTIRINSFELHSEHSLDKFDDVENHYKKILNNNKNYNILGVIRDKAQSNKKVELQHVVFGSAGNDIINFDHGTMVAKGGNGSDMYVIDSNIERREIIIDNNSDDKKLDMLVMPEVPEEFSIQQCNLHLNYNNTRIQVRNYLQGNSYRHLMVMNSKGETFIPYVQSMLCVGSPIENGKLVPFFHTTQTQNMFLLPKDFQGDHVVIDSNLEDIEKYKDEDDLLLIRERGIPFVTRIEDFYNDQSKWRDVKFLLWSNGNFFPYLGLQQEVDGIMEYKDKLKNDYEKVIKEYVIDFTKSVSITHNQDGTLTSVGQDEERIGVVILKDITPDRIRVSSSNTDLVFFDEVSSHVINIKNWDNSESYRIATLEFDVGLEAIIIRRLDRFSLSNIAEIQDLINKASEICQKKAGCEANIEAKNNDGQTQFHVAAQEGKLRSIRFLIGKYAEPDELVKAVRQRERLKSLINEKDKFGYTPLQYAAKNGKWDIVNLFLDKTAERNPDDVANKDRFSISWSTIHYGVYNGDVNLLNDIFQILSDKGTIINTKDSSDWTPLHYAVYYNALDVVKFLVNKGSDINAKNKDDKTPLDIAKDKGHNNIVEYLEKKLREERGKPVQRKRRYHHVDHSHHHSSQQPLTIDVSNQPEIAASSTTRPSSWINDLFSWVKSSVGGLFHSRAVLVDAPIDVNGTIMLLDVLIRKVTGQKYISSVDQATSLLEAQNYALNITNEFEKVVKQAASKSEISIHRLNINFMKIHDEITEEIIGGKFNEISGILKSHIEKACPDREAGYPGKLSPKKFDKFKDELNKGLDATLKQEILHSRDSKLEVSNVKGSLKPRSDLNNTCIQGHLTQARNVRLG
ncbi:Latrotoxin, C-terminal domain,Serralysin-like metalloprotease, C-terminal,Ankyrin repeat-containing [Cinara cedri]|uniref:Latrotoxin, C-terminal domain,Serralysin-like metalloprotease, C-terminal,Ankyrin repeat-containing n=1 Tax=Cinara cedri TaxID=506608 RepID=A0A5E4MC34_9HEMI|nr:Latrotoxin, C-terminal domain,Serralysin-like metalloprotease, C-terminal,Ankyrin repeat-containing [Cinara cedri]